MKRVLVLALLAFSLAAGAEEIRTFGVDVEIGADGSLRLREEIGVFFDFARHGLIRELPVSYRLPTGERYSLRVTVDEVQANGASVPYQTYREGNNLVVKIGDPDKTVRGLVVYTLRYTVARAVRVYDTEAEVYWNVIGTEWAMPIRQAQVRISLPAGVAPDQVRFTGFRGFYGATSLFELAQEGLLLWGQAAELRPGEGITVVVRLPRQAVRLPGFGQNLIWFLQDNLYAGIPLVVLVGMLVVWWRRGRDPKVGTVAPEFKPPEGIGPAEAGALVDDRADPRDFAAGILSLAVKGHLKIREIWENERDREPRDFELVAQASSQPLTPYERMLLNHLMGHHEQRKLSDLKYKLYDKMAGLNARLYMDLTEAGYYVSNPDRVRGAYRAAAVFLGVLALLLGFWLNSLYLGVALGLSALIMFVFAPLMPAKTAKGIEALRRVLGLQEYIRRAEADRIEFAAKEKHFEELLPYAMALGLTEVWTQKFEGLLQQPPSWYEGRFPTFAPARLGTRLDLLQRHAYTAATAAPRSAQRGGWSGGSGFGGRGFSGGGMGGGGGRGW